MQTTLTRIRNWLRRNSVLRLWRLRNRLRAAEARADYQQTLNRHLARRLEEAQTDNRTLLQRLEAHISRTDELERRMDGVMSDCVTLNEQAKELRWELEKAKLPDSL